MRRRSGEYISEAGQILVDTRRQCLWETIFISPLVFHVLCRNGEGPVFSGSDELLADAQRRKGPPPRCDEGKECNRKSVAILQSLLFRGAIAAVARQNSRV